MDNPNQAEDVRVLLVDDDPTILRTLSIVLSSSGIAHATASGAGEALALCEHHPYDLIVSDIGMPEMDGVQLAQRLRRQYPDMRLIAFTGSVVGKLLEEVQAIFDETYEKPRDFVPLSQTIGQYLDRPSAS